jgi:2-methylcitrate dehydratase PrpD
MTAAAGVTAVPPPLAARLAAFAHGLRRDDIGAAAARHAAALILDAVGCALAGWQAEETSLVLRAARGLGGQGGASIIGGSAPASLAAAVVANAYLTTAVTACDVYLPAHCHLTPEVVPAALAIAEAEHASGPALLTAVTAGLEVASRLLRAVDYTEFRGRGWHSPGVIGPVGAAVAAGLLLGLGEDELRSAMSLAVSQAAGTFAAWPTTAVKFHQARGALAGVIAATLAAQGFQAGPEPFEAPDGGLFASYAPGDASAALAGLGRDWELEQISVRLWPGAAAVQALLTALLGTGRRLPGAAELTGMEIRVPPATYQAHRDVVHPAGTFEALLSFHYVAAATIAHGRFGIDLAGAARRDDPQIATLIDRRIRLLPDPAVPRGGVHVTLRRHGGGAVVIREQAAAGTPGRAATPAQLRGKFLAGAAPRIGQAAARQLLDRLGRLEDVTDCADLLRLTQGGAG